MVDRSGLDHEELVPQNVDPAHDPCTVIPESIDATDQRRHHGDVKARRWWVHPVDTIAATGVQSRPARKSPATLAQLEAVSE